MFGCEDTNSSPHYHMPYFFLIVLKWSSLGYDQIDIWMLECAKMMIITYDSGWEDPDSTSPLPGRWFIYSYNSFPGAFVIEGVASKLLKWHLVEASRWKEQATTECHFGLPTFVWLEKQVDDCLRLTKWKRLRGRGWRGGRESQRARWTPSKSSGFS